MGNDYPSENKIKWLCRRGTKELDVILVHFFDTQYHHLSTEEQQEFAILLRCEDSQLANWLYLKRGNIYKGLENIVTKILSANPSAD